MTWVWLALTADRPAGADAAAPAGGDGWLAVWTRRARPLPDARRADARLFDPGGRAATVSLVLPPPGVRLKFDDLAVQQARRRVLAQPPLDAISTLLCDASHFAGAISVARDDRVPRLRDDPFARLFPARLLDVGPGLLGSVPPPAGPTIERYGSDQPWPWDRFSAP